MLVAIIGTGGMGQAAARFLKGDFEVFLAGRDYKKSAAVAGELGVSASGFEDAVSKADAVIVAVPIENTAETCNRAAKLMKKGALLVDIASVKTGIVDRVSVPNDIEYISAHPLFGPVRPAENQNIALIPVKTRAWLPRVERFLRKRGLNAAVIDAETHDRVMAANQLLTHFALLGYSDALRGWGVSPETLARLSTPKSRDMQELASRAESERALIETMQKKNPYGKRIRKAFLSACEKLDKKL